MIDPGEQHRCRHIGPFKGVRDGKVFYRCRLGESETCPHTGHARDHKGNGQRPKRRVCIMPPDVIETRSRINMDALEEATHLRRETTQKKD